MIHTTLDTFFSRQLDYCGLIYGLSFIILAIFAFVFIRRKDTLLPWKWLFVFAVTHSIKEFFEMAYFSIPTQEIQCQGKVKVSYF